MGIGFFRKIKDFAGKLFKGGKKLVKDVLSIAAPIIKTVLPKVLPQAAPFIDPILNVASNLTGANLDEPEEDDYDNDKEYMKLKTGI